MQKSDTPPVKIIAASKTLQAKAGNGDIPQGLIVRAEQSIQQNAEDFLPIAQGFLNRLKDGIEKGHQGSGSKEGLLSGLTSPVMDLKANARMFKYDLVTSLANIMLDFLEHLDELDDTAIDIVAAHHQTLTLIIAKKMSGDGGPMGETLQKELVSAIGRYISRTQ